MTGGQVYVYDPEERLPLRLNDQLVGAYRPAADELAETRALVERHHRFTGSDRAGALLAEWDEACASFWRVAPRAEVARLQSEYEGTVSGSAP
jgi:glutamate synthase domain-containing protein 3